MLVRSFLFLLQILLLRPSSLFKSLSHITVILFLKKGSLCGLYLFHITMSVSYLLFLFLCISMHACNARCPSSLDRKNVERTIHLSIKNDSISKKNFLEDLSTKQLGPRNEGEAEKPKIMGTMRSKERVLKEKVKEKGKAASGSLHLQTHEWVSRRMPHKRKGDKNNPGFNLDYSPPKTHPPSHN